MLRTITYNEEETMTLGAEFAKARLKTGDVVALIGELGAGKTRFIKGICSALGVVERVSSPSFTIVNEYLSNVGKIFHFDFYRISSISEVVNIGFDDYIYNEGICLIEWGDRVKEILPTKRYDINFKFGESDSEREIIINFLDEEMK